MFTGLIETIGKVKSAQRSSDSMRLGVDIGRIAYECRFGDSISVNGACLTVTDIQGTVGFFDVSSETLGKSNLGKLNTGSAVNIERAMKADSRFGGHMVQGHLDGTAKVEKIDQSGKFWTIRFVADAALLNQMVKKGSVAVNGISLTVADMDNSGFSVAVIPETLKRTTLGQAKPGDEVNIETDMVVKVIKKQLGSIAPDNSSLSIDKLKEMGF